MSIAEFLHPQAILLNLEAPDATEVITRLGNNLKELGFVKDNFVEATLAREASLPTGLPLAGDVNAAIPHVDIEYVRQPALGLATLKQPVVFHHMVETEIELPVRLVIMLALDQPKSQIEMLQQVATVLQQPATIESLLAASTAEQVLAILGQVEGLA